MQTVMQIVTRPYQQYLDGHYYQLQPVCSFGDYEILSASQEDIYLLLIVNDVEQSVVECQYEEWHERYKDIELLEHIPPEGGASAGVIAWLKPLLPLLSGSNARPFPPVVQPIQPAT